MNVAVEIKQSSHPAILTLDAAFIQMWKKVKKC